MRRLSLFIVVLILVIAMPVSAKMQSGSTNGIDVSCPDGTEILNGVQVIVNMRPNFTYTATAIGVNGYDPVIGVGDSEGITLCNDDEPSAGQYTVSLPATGEIDASDVNAQMPFYHSNSGLTDISLVIGSPDGSDGEFVLVLEGMAVTSSDGRGVGAGDPYRVQVTQNMIDSGVPLEVYMISKVRQLNPFMQLADSDGNVITQKDGTAIECDDSGTKSCWGSSDNLENSFVQAPNAKGIPGGAADAMIALDLSNLSLDADPENNYLRYLMTSAGQKTFGEYIVVMRIGVQAAGSSSTSTTDNTDNGQTTSNTDNTDTTANTDTTNGKPPFGGLASGVPAPNKTKKGANGISVTCPDDTEINNGVHISVNVEPGATYTATAIGINGYDPIIAVANANGVQDCVDDDKNASQYSVSLPTTGAVDPSDTSSQISLTNDSGDYVSLSLIIGSTDSSSGEFALVLEGKSVDKNDGKGEGSGDLYSVQLTQNMLDSGVPLNIYMMTTGKKLDPMLQMVNADNTIVKLDDGSRVECDNAGDDCWSNIDDLSNSFAANVDGTSSDAALSIALDSLTLDKNPDNNFFNFLMTSVSQRTFGDYVAVFHIGVK